jgi:farnesyl-diphosphate farnesyltransferase
VSDELLTSLLRDVSRSFYLTLRVLPRAVRDQIGIAYLLARTTDTIADTEIVPVGSRLEALSALRRRIRGESGVALPFLKWQQPGGSEREQVLLARCEESVRLLEHLEEADRTRGREVLETIVGGQELDLKRFNGGSVERIVALKTWDELDDYTYRVAGCVGEFWTKMCRAHLIAGAEIDDKAFVEKGIRFGKGLQLVNILRDIPKDLRIGRCYIPQALLTQSGLTPQSLLLAENEGKFRPVYNQLLNAAKSHLAAGWEYTLLIPHEQMRLRLACAWPLLIGARTLERLRVENMLDANRRVKVSRAEVRGIMLRSVVLYPWQTLWQHQFNKEAQRGE